METRETIVSKIEMLQKLSQARNLSTYSKTRLTVNLKALQEQLIALDNHGDIAMVQQMILENDINQ